MRVIVTRPAAEAQGWADALRARGFDAVALPLIEIRPVPDPSLIRAAWRDIDACHAVMFVSANAVRAFFAQRPHGATFVPRAWATGAGTRHALLAAGVASEQVDSPPGDAAQFDSESLWGTVRPQCKAGHRVLFVRGGDAGATPSGRDWLERALGNQGVATSALLAYVRGAPAWHDP